MNFRITLSPSDKTTSRKMVRLKPPAQRAMCGTLCKETAMLGGCLGNHNAITSIKITDISL